MLSELFTLVRQAINVIAFRSTRPRAELPLKALKLETGYKFLIVSLVLIIECNKLIDWQRCDVLKKTLEQ